jgi:hypothetical protein
MAIPTLTTQDATSIAYTSATGNGTVVTGASITRRGFQFNTVEYPDREVYEDGSFGTGAYTATISGLTPGKKYYYRAFATNADGTGYGGWAFFTTTSPIYNVTINSIDRTDDIMAGTLRIDSVVNDQVDTCSFVIDDLHSNGIPNNDEEISITLDDGTKLFGGYVVNVKMQNKVKGGGVVRLGIDCVDHTRLLDRNLVHKTYLNQTDKEIIESIVSTYCIGSGITTTNVVEGVTINQIAFNYIQPSQALRHIAELTGRNWYLDYNKDLHYFPATQTAAPLNITSSSTHYWDLSISRDSSQIKNRVYVRGGTKLSEYTTYEEVGDGEKRQFVLPDKPHDVTMEVDTGGGYVTKTVGIKNIDTSGFDWYLNFQEKYIEQDSGGAILTSAHKMRLTYKYDIPVLVAVENTASIIANGQREFAIFDKQITTTQAARDRASAELTDYANDLIEGSFKTWAPGYVVGQYININLTEYDVNADYVVQKVSARSYGAGTYEYTISIASAKTMGIIKFLIELLEVNKNLIELDEDEVVDELLQLTDSLMSDSLIDSLIIDSAGPYFVYQDDSLSLDDPGVARWALSAYKYG